MLVSKEILPSMRLNDLGNMANKKQLKNWAIPIVVAMLINVGLFGLMAGLVRKVPARPDLDNELHAVSVIRIKRPDTSVMKKEKKPPPKPEKKKIQPLKDNLAMPKPVQKKIRLPFELNSKLPSGPQTLAMPSLDLLALSAGGFKDAYGVNEIDAPLTALAKIAPVYPMRAKRLAIEGWVSVRFLINEEGLVEHAEIIEADPPNMFENSVINCVTKWRFKPGTIEGIAVKTWAETTIRFELED